MQRTLFFLLYNKQYAPVQLLDTLKQEEKLATGFHQMNLGDTVSFPLSQTFGEGMLSGGLPEAALSNRAER